MSDYELKDKGIKGDTEATSAIATISYEIENGIYHGLTDKQLKKQIEKLQKRGQFPSNMKYIDSFYDKKTGLSGTAFLDQTTGKVVIGFAGTNLDNGLWESSKDLLADLNIGIKGESASDAYFNAGHQFINKISEHYSISTVTGHSKGGRDGAVLGLAHEIPNVVLYNAAPVNNKLGQVIGSGNVLDLLFKLLGNYEMDKIIKNYKGKFVYFVSENDPLNEWAARFNSLYPGKIYVIKNGEAHAVSGFLSPEAQAFIKANIANLNKKNSDLQTVTQNTKNQLKKLQILRQKLLISHGGLSSGEKLYLDAAEALALTRGMKATLNIEMSALKKMYQQTIEERGQLWQSTRRAGESIGNVLSHNEVLSALMSGGADEGRIKIIPIAEYNQKIAKLTNIEKDYDELIAKINQIITKQLAADRELAHLIRG